MWHKYSKGYWNENYVTCQWNQRKIRNKVLCAPWMSRDLMIIPGRLKKRPGGDYRGIEPSRSQSVFRADCPFGSLVKHHDKEGRRSCPIQSRCWTMNLNSLTPDLHRSCKISAFVTRHTPIRVRRSRKLSVQVCRLGVLIHFGAEWYIHNIRIMCIIFRKGFPTWPSTIPLLLLKVSWENLRSLRSSRLLLMLTMEPPIQTYIC